MAQPNVGFKLGSQAKIDTLVNQVVEGSYGIFYLTKDTSRLYVGNEENKIVPVNAGIITVKTVNDLPTVSGLSATEKANLAGNYYYVEDSNILCVFNGSKWVQINSVVTNTSMTQTASTITDGAKLTTTINDSNSNSVNANFSVKGTDGITITGTGDVITVKGDPITVSIETADNTATATIKSASAATNTTLAIKGDENVSVSSKDNVITIKAEDRYVTAVKASAVSEGFSFSTTDNKGNGSTAGTISPVIKVGVNDTVEKKFENGTATLPVYTKTEIDGIKNTLDANLEQSLKAFNAMEYKGTVGSDADQTSLPEAVELVKSGYSYLVSGSLYYSGISYPSGTLVVATGEEDTNGYLNDPIDWTFVTGSTNDTTYSGVVRTDGAYALKPSTGGNDVASVNVKAGTGMEVETSGAVGDTTQVYTVNHKSYDSTSYSIDSDSNPANSTMNVLQKDYVIPVIDTITVENGHITGVSVTKHTIKDSNVSIASTTASVNTVANVATVTHATRLTDGNGNELKPVSDASFTIGSSSLAISNTGSNVVMNLEWGSFDD